MRKDDYLCCKLEHYYVIPQQFLLYIYTFSSCLTHRETIEKPFLVLLMHDCLVSNLISKTY